MLKKLYHHIFDRKNFFSSLNDFKEFENYRIGINTSRTNICITLLFPLMLFLYCLSMFFYNTLKINYLYKNHIFFIHIFLCIICIFWFIYYKLLYNNLKFIYNRIIYWVFINLIICTTTLIGLYNPNNYSEISAYIMIIFIACAIFYIPPATSIPTFGVSYLITILFIFYNKSIPLNIKISAFISCTIALLFSLLISYNLYLHFFDNYKRSLELLRSNEKLEELESSKSLYFTNFSHDLKTPLNIIYSAQQMLMLIIEKENINNTNYIKYLNIIKHNTNTLTKLIENLIDISKLESNCFKINLVNEDIVKVVENICLSAASYVNDNGLSITFDTDYEEKIIAFAPDLIERVILNLLSNAIKFTPKGGNILVTINTTDEYIYISVKDTGIGIPKNMLDSIFNRFTQVEGQAMNKHGSGIGLSLVKSLIELHEGTITVESKVNEGSTFTFTLPNRMISTKINNNFETSKSERIDFEFSDIRR